ncbi:probable E3 ubiquitin-protein ligase RHY1A isoform X1 [Helianthus annuus]|uniref:probable E3 ubiquitin-protein ligase RHY1A isoform X1 n=1 Tax=Helianthus annuus TaxID=4232 RepID=UPI000B8F5C6F|nr:probable E3 ubiquitin-protein ligase RHY1A isoform X1 [Helianthus annuus]
MAGTIPGVESARRRRFHGGSDSSFTINLGYRSTRSRDFYNTHLTTTSFLQTCMINNSDQDGKLGCVARKAKERLDERLRSHRKSETNSSQERSRGASLVKEIERKPSSSMVVGDLQMEGFGLKRSGSKKFSWGKMGLIWKSSEQDECVVCLEKFKVGEKLDRLPCAHRFHSVCLLPWLESHAHCPCCRMSVLGSN